MPTTTKSIQKNEANTSLEEEYIKTLEDHEQQAYTIAKRQLKSSFSLKKSIGFKKFIEEKTLKRKL